MEISSCVDATCNESVQLPKSVEHLELDGIAFTGTHFFADFTSLKTLKLSECDFSSTTMASLAKKCLELQNLTICYMSFDNADIFADFKSLKSIELNYNDASNSTLNCIAKNCLRLQSLEINRKCQFSS